MNGNSPTIFRRWIHSHEEDTEDTMVFRTTDYKFPLSRGRQAFEFKENGEFIEYDVGPTDRGMKVFGRFEYDGKGLITIHFEDHAIKPVVLKLISLNGNALKIKK